MRVQVRVARSAVVMVVCSGDQTGHVDLCNRTVASGCTEADLGIENAKSNPATARLVPRSLSSTSIRDTARAFLCADRPGSSV